MEPSQRDKALSGFNHSFCDNDRETIPDKFAEFDESSCRLNEFYFQKIGIQKYGELSFFLRHILILSHWEASLERGFSINNAILETNMLLETAASKRIARCHIIAKGLHPYTIKTSYYKKYTLSLEEQTKLKLTMKKREE